MLKRICCRMSLITRTAGAFTGDFSKADLGVDEGPFATEQPSAKRGNPLDPSGFKPTKLSPATIIGDVGHADIVNSIDHGFALRKPGHHLSQLRDDLFGLVTPSGRGSAPHLRCHKTYFKVDQFNGGGSVHCRNIFAAARMVKYHSQASCSSRPLPCLAYRQTKIMCRFALFHKVGEHWW